MTGDMDRLEALFAEARGGETPGDDLVARVLADADRVQAGLAETPGAPARGGGLLGGVLSNIGGWFGAGGLVAATMAGLLIGVYAPDSVDSALGGQLSTFGLVTGDELLPGLSDLLPGQGG
ncbi:hypothetical protein [Nioella sp.]|uniref:hypothetical protein n=1 Tax=Nioella sp. TaxID=1912091 RepID=UPI00351928EA